ncbi:hypothetical protein [Marinifilum caeruleilacunae]|uniref:Uncharacterized protein n=1 Tax=Marinifilum caeruleilacunae TaxID=2499076 RepID=A0ABX1WUB9_9BACT|nr:hypothetical protein [Marinifilum caeruleilacunae]NOU59616.1 hypothetical protein [Marinifilum caeruleilacunae]
MNIKNTILLAFLIISSFVANCQFIDKEFVDNWTKETYDLEEIKSDTKYIIYGEVLDWKEDKSFNTNKFVATLYLDKSMSDNIIHNFPVIIIVHGKSSKKITRRNFNEIRKCFRTNSKSNPVLMIDGKQIKQSLCNQVIRSLKPNKILNCINTSIPVSIKKYGMCGKNGIVVIKTI